MEKRIISLALAFSAILNEWLTPEQMQEINRLNKTPEYSNGSCATHNFCDPNQAMIDAETALFGEILDIVSEENIDLINKTWEFARANDFFTAIYQPNYAVATGDTLYALSAASSFMSGFVGDDAQDEPVDNDLDIIDREIARLEGRGVTVLHPFAGITVEGGIVQDIYSNVARLKVVVIDNDDIAHDPDAVLSISEAGYRDTLSEVFAKKPDGKESKDEKKDRLRIVAELKEEGL